MDCRAGVHEEHTMTERTVDRILYVVATIAAAYLIIRCFQGVLSHA